MHGHASSEKLFDASAVGWLLRLLFFPSGLVTLSFAVFLLRRAPRAPEAAVRQAARLRLEGTLRRLRPDEVARVCEQYALPRAARLAHDACPLCIGGGSGRFAQLPCAHVMHVGCLRDALKQDLATCPECGWCVKSLFGIEPRIPKIDV